jgi:hypothetical protein
VPCPSCSQDFASDRIKNLALMPPAFPQFDGTKTTYRTKVLVRVP